MRETRALQLLVVASIAAIVLVVQSDRHAVAQTQSRSQYQLAAGRYSVLIDGAAEPLQLNTIFRIDTTTGKTWLFHAATRNGKATEKWVEIAEK